MNNIKNIKNTNTTKIYNRLDYKVGEEFLAKVVNIDHESHQAELQLLNGWKFKAKIQDDQNLNENFKGLCKFKVNGYENGELEIALLDKKNINKVNEFKSYKDIFSIKGYNPEDAELLYNMVKNGIPLTKENFSRIKAIMYLKNILKDNKYNEDFINKFMINENMENDSQVIKNAQNNFMKYFKLLTLLEENDILFLYKNDIDLSKESIKSYMKFCNDSGTLYKDFKDINNNLLTQKNDKNQNINLENNDSNTINIIKNDINYSSKEQKQIDTVRNDINKDESNIQNVEENFEGNKNISKNNIDKNSSEVKELKNTIKEILTEIQKSEDNATNSDSTIKVDYIKNLEENSNQNPSSIEKVNNNNDNNSDNIDKTQNKIEITDENTNEKQNKVNLKESESAESQNELEHTEKNIDTNENNIEQPKEIVNKNHNKIDNNINKKDANIKNTLQEAESAIDQTKSTSKIEVHVENNINLQNLSEIIKNDIDQKIHYIKSTINLLLNNKYNSDSQLTQNISKILKHYGSDIKTYNTISNQYYYLDLPISIDKNEYKFKLIIKDDRKSGKKIDTKNVKIATSVRTFNMGTVDIYLTVKNNNMDVNIKCEKNYVKILERDKDKLKKILNNGNYNVYINVNEKKQQLTLANCSTFFENVNLNNIDIFV